jgi:hypothetical protein
MKTFGTNMHSASDKESHPQGPTYKDVLVKSR